jgi:hypothetical protein
MVKKHRKTLCRTRMTIRGASIIAAYQVKKPNTRFSITKVDAVVPACMIALAHIVAL